jgi:general secretion pathway protein G
MEEGQMSTRSGMKTGTLSRRRGTTARRGFTLIEVLLVLIILAILAGTATLFVRQARERALSNAARSQIGVFEQAIDLYELDMRAYPATNQGLVALIQPPSDADSVGTWGGPYLKSSSIPNDPWGTPYQYESTVDAYRIWSMGYDRQDGTEDDITSGS